jgi:hypothetical protein
MNPKKKAIASPAVGKPAVGSNALVAPFHQQPLTAGTESGWQKSGLRLHGVQCRNILYGRFLGLGYFQYNIIFVQALM